jgi:GNAT superfamily N-acetyltransferase
MNFYSTDIINEMIDTSPLEDLIEEIEDFKAQMRYLCKKYALAFLGFQYINAVVDDEKNTVCFRCLNEVFDISNCPSIMVYRKVPKSDAVYYYILLICTSHKYKGQGFASQLLNDFVGRVRSEDSGIKRVDPENENFVVCSTDAKRPKKIVLSSIETAVTFYETYGFRWIPRQTLTDHPTLMRYEKWDKEKEYFIMELLVE